MSGPRFSINDSDGANLLDRARQEYPRLPSNIAYRENYGAQGRGKLEYYPAGELDSFDKSRPAVEVFNQGTRPKDVAADIVSHGMVDSDPVVGQAYRKFLMSMQPWQQLRLQKQYEHARKHEGEERPFHVWAEMTGQPAWLRGYAFDQWDSPEEMYTPQQIEGLNGVVRYLKSK